MLAISAQEFEKKYRRGSADEALAMSLVVIHRAGGFKLTVGEIMRRIHSMTTVVFSEYKIKRALSEAIRKSFIQEMPMKLGKRVFKSYVSSRLTAVSASAHYFCMPPLKRGTSDGAFEGLDAIVDCSNNAEGQTWDGGHE